MTSTRRGFSAVELLVVVVVVGIAAAITLPAMLRSARNDRLAKCEANLRMLGQCDVVARSVPGGLPTVRGSKYWEKLAADTKLVPDVLTCPLSPQSRYRGPS